MAGKPPAAAQVRGEATRKKSGATIPRLPFKLPNLLGKQLRANALAVFYRSLSAMTRAGVRIERALQLLGEQEDDPRMAEVCRSLQTNISHGKSLSTAMSQWPDVFSSLELRLVQVGEMTGNIDRILERLANYEESRRSVTMRVKSALTYPAFVFALAMAALVILPPYLFGGLFKLIENFGVEIPLITRVVLVFAKVVSNPIFIAVLAAGVVAGFKILPVLLRRPDVQLKVAGFSLRVPVIGAALRTIAVTRFARALEIMMNCGVTLDQGLQLSMAASGNPVLIQRLPRALERLRGGATLREVLEETSFFGQGFLSMTSIGEESGKLPALLSRLAQMYEMELGYVLETLVAALEPLMLLVMGLLVGLFIVATMLPMMQVIRAL